MVLSYRAMRRGERYVHGSFRGILGVLLMIGGILGFLPILGFWMFPLGLAFIAIDIPPMRRWFIKQLNASRRKLR